MLKLELINTISKNSINCNLVPVGWKNWSFNTNAFIIRSDATDIFIESLEHEITTVLTDLLKISGIFERSDMESRKEEGRETLSGELYGHVPRYGEIEENGLKFLVDLHYGQKNRILS